MEDYTPPINIVLTTHLHHNTTVNPALSVDPQGELTNQIIILIFLNKACRLVRGGHGQLLAIAADRAATNYLQVCNRENKWVIIE